MVVMWIYLKRVSLRGDASTIFLSLLPYDSQLLESSSLLLALDDFTDPRENHPASEMRERGAGVKYAS